MKKSTILFCIAVLVTVLTVSFKQILGNIQVYSQDNRPANFISGLWMKFNDVKLTHKLNQDFKHIKVIGGKRLLLELLKNDSISSIFSAEPTRYTFEVKNDTIYIKSSDYTKVDIRTKQNIQSISIDKSGLRLLTTGYSNLVINAKNKSNVNYVVNNSYDGKREYRDTTDILQSLKINLANESQFVIDKSEIKHIDATIDHSTFSYTATQKSDSISVNLIGKSSVLSTDKTVINQIKTLNVSGNKQYFKPEFAGKQVKVILK